MISILQPFIPHYRAEFFAKLNQLCNVKLFIYENKEVVNKGGFKQSDVLAYKIRNLRLGPFLVYSPFPLLKSETVVLMLHYGHITTWIILLTKMIHRKRIILWGHGISIKRYLNEEKNPNLLMKIMVSLADTVWLYTEKEKELWSKRFPKKHIVSLSNTVDTARKSKLVRSTCSIKLKEREKITHEKCLIFCARFETPHRRPDILLELISKLSNYGFIIIGEGRFKPSFAGYKNVYDYGGVYDEELKSDLFSIADLYIQPAWVGLSIVEAMARGLPVCTLIRRPDILQCVEYHYLENEYNAIIAGDVQQLCNRIKRLTNEEISLLSINAKSYVAENLTMNNMVKRARESL